ncbi:hypothetical protein HK105_203856 [Polyrhizophydium stewartii]|uniref:Uncharacterized protein n=1 Tax=Polyrhizophydium stewartii TaxID=2732419 RepID=A0ABR4NAF8_9FUNG
MLREMQTGQYQIMILSTVAFLTTMLLAEQRPNNWRSYLVQITTFFGMICSLAGIINNQWNTALSYVVTYAVAWTGDILCRLLLLLFMKTRLDVVFRQAATTTKTGPARRARLNLPTAVATLCAGAQIACWAFVAFCDLCRFVPSRAVADIAERYLPVAGTFYTISDLSILFLDAMVFVQIIRVKRQVVESEGNTWLVYKTLACVALSAVLGAIEAVLFFNSLDPFFLFYGFAFSSRALLTELFNITSTHLVQIASLTQVVNQIATNISLLDLGSLSYSLASSVGWSSDLTTRLLLLLFMKTRLDAVFSRTVSTQRSTLRTALRGRWATLLAYACAALQTGAAAVAALSDIGRFSTVGALASWCDETHPKAASFYTASDLSVILLDAIVFDRIWRLARRTSVVAKADAAWLVWKAFFFLLISAAASVCEAVLFAMSLDESYIFYGLFLTTRIIFTEVFNILGLQILAQALPVRRLHGQQQKLQQQQQQQQQQQLRQKKVQAIADASVRALAPASVAFSEQQCMPPPRLASPRMHRHSRTS